MPNNFESENNIPEGGNTSPQAVRRSPVEPLSPISPNKSNSPEKSTVRRPGLDPKRLVDRFPSPVGVKPLDFGFQDNSKISNSPVRRVGLPKRTRLSDQFRSPVKEETSFVKLLEQDGHQFFEYNQDWELVVAPHAHNHGVRILASYAIGKLRKDLQKREFHIGLFSDKEHDDTLDGPVTAEAYYYAMHSILHSRENLNKNLSSLLLRPYDCFELRSYFQGSKVLNLITLKDNVVYGYKVHELKQGNNVASVINQNFKSIVLDHQEIKALVSDPNSFKFIYVIDIRCLGKQTDVKKLNDQIVNALNQKQYEGRKDFPAVQLFYKDSRGDNQLSSLIEQKHLVRSISHLISSLPNTQPRELNEPLPVMVQSSQGSSGSSTQLRGVNEPLPARGQRVSRQEEIAREEFAALFGELSSLLNRRPDAVAGFMPQFEALLPRLSQLDQQLCRDQIAAIERHLQSNQERLLANRIDGRFQEIITNLRSYLLNPDQILQRWIGWIPKQAADNLVWTQVPLNYTKNDISLIKNWLDDGYRTVNQYRSELMNLANLSDGNQNIRERNMKAIDTYLQSNRARLDKLNGLIEGEHQRKILQNFLSKLNGILNPVDPKKTTTKKRKVPEMDPIVSVKQALIQKLEGDEGAKNLLRAMDDSQIYRVLNGAVNINLMFGGKSPVVQIKQRIQSLGRFVQAFGEAYIGGGIQRLEATFNDRNVLENWRERDVSQQLDLLLSVPDLERANAEDVQRYFAQQLGPDENILVPSSF